MIRIYSNATIINKHGEMALSQAIVIKKDHIAWLGPAAEIPPSFDDKAEKMDCKDQLITPALIDCHTHLVYAGNRAKEFQQRLEGLSYQDIAKKGGGILSSVLHTRKASFEELYEASLPRLLALKKEGVGTVEIKSGYGLDLETELKMLRVAKRLGEENNLRIITTFLGAHALPPEYKQNSKGYVDYLCETVMPRVAELKLADFIDVFCESIGFNLEQTEQIFEKAHSLKLSLKCHAEQLSNIGATELAAKYGAHSSDHLEYIDEAGVLAMAKHQCVAVLLPGAFYYLKETQKPPIHLFRKAGVGMAIATDCNPGTSPTTSLLLMMNMACQLFNLTVAEAISAVTYQAARALGIDNVVGSIEVGKRAELLLWPVREVAELCYGFGYPLIPTQLF